MRVVSLFLSMTACNNELTSNECDPRRSEASIGLDESSSLGFSANEVLDAMPLVFDVLVTGVRGTPEKHRSFAFSFESDGRPRVEERGSAAGDPYRYCISGTSLAIPIVMTVESTDGWFSGSGPATVFAQATTDDRIWVDGTFEIEPSDELHTFAENANHVGCTASDLSLSYSQSGEGRAPWSIGPNGGMSFHTCDGSGALYRWGLEDPAAE